MHTDPISDLLTRIRNSLAVGRPEVWVPYSKLKMAILGILFESGWIESVQHVTPQTSKLPRSAKKSDQMRVRFDQIRIVLRYDSNRRPAISSITRISTPSRRVYVGKGELPKVLGGMGMAIVSTSQGMLTNREAQKRGLGGEIICEVY